MSKPRRREYDHEITFTDEMFEDSPFIFPDGKRVYASCTVVVRFDTKQDSCDYPNNTSEEWVEVTDWEADILIEDISAFDEQGEPVEVTEEMREHFVDAFDLTEGHKEKMLEEAENDSERRREEDYCPDDDY